MDETTQLISNQGDIEKKCKFEHYIIIAMSIVILTLLITFAITFKINRNNYREQTDVPDDSNMEWFDLSNVIFYHKDNLCNQSKTHLERKAKMDSLACPMFKFGSWINYPYCNMGPNCSNGKILIHKTNDFMMGTEICYDKCKVSGRQCYKNIDPSALYYNMKEDYCSVIRIRCKSMTPVTPLIGLAQVYFL